MTAIKPTIANAVLQDIVCLFVLLTCPSISPGTTQTLQKEGPGISNREKVVSLIRQTAERGVFKTEDGLVVRREIPPTPIQIQEMRRLGNVAFQILEEYAWGKQSLESRIAIRFIGELGGKKGAEILGRIVEGHPSSNMRFLALRWLSGELGKLTLASIQKAARADRDESVRNLAKEILARNP